MTALMMVGVGYRCYIFPTSVGPSDHLFPFIFYILVYHFPPCVAARKEESVFFLVVSEHRVGWFFVLFLDFTYTFFFF